MLYFYCTDDLEAVRRAGAVPDALSGLKRFATLEAARADCPGQVLVVQADEPAGAPAVAGEVPRILNLHPYRAAVPVTAAGGFLVRTGTAEPELLLIFRRGVWDLPKGKLDAGEAVETCALREVREELGIRQVDLVAPLGTTCHAYPDGPSLAVKTTHWFLMRTPETRFTPQREEEIEAVAWVPWTEAAERVGFGTLRGHIARCTQVVRQAVRRMHRPNIM